MKRLTEENEPLRVRDIADSYKVSLRTVKYDLEVIRFWLGREKNQIVRLESLPSAGIWLSGDPAAKLQLTAMLGQFELTSVFHGQEERVRYLLLFLLLNNDYITVSQLAEKIGVSRNTILSDLLKADSVFNNHGLTLTRKAHKGIIINGTELSRRLAIEGLMQNFMRANDMAGIVLSLSQGVCVSSFFNSMLTQYFLDNRALAAVYRCIEAFTKQASGVGGITLSDRDLVSLLFRLCVVIQRVKQGVILDANDQALWGNESGQELSAILSRHVNALAAELNLSLPDAERRFILQILPGNMHQMQENAAGENLAALVSELIRQISGHYNKSFSRDAQLHSDLLAHISDKWMKYLYRVIEPNPLAADVIRSYHALFTAVRTGCDSVFKQSGFVLHDSDVAYITLHFQAAFERNQATQTTRALLVCATGRGSARLLKERLRREIPGLQISGFCSIADVERATRMTPVDLIISVLPLTSKIPVVVINPIPRKQDIANIMARVEDLQTVSPTAEPSAATAGLSTFDQLRDNIPLSAMPFAEGISQEIIQSGFELANAITQEFAEQLSEPAKTGLMLHLLLMMNRMAFGCPYIDFHYEQASESDHTSEMYRKLRRLVSDRYRDIPNSEIWAIARYFTEKE